MARTITQIQNVIIAELGNNGIIVSSNKFSRRRLWTYVVAFCIYIVEMLFDTHKTETEQKLRALKTPSREWYKQLCLNFQYGFPLIPETDQFNNTGYTDEQIEAAKVVKYAAVIKQVNSFGRVLLRLKLAGSSGDDLAQLDPSVVTAIRAYFDKAECAGDNLSIESMPADKIIQKWVVYYDPLVLKATGGRVDGTESAPVRDAILSFLREGMDVIGGTYVRTYHTDWVQKVPGVVIPKITECEATHGGLAFQAVDEMYTPDSGWLRFENESDLVIEYISQGVI